jgi:DHA3 family macrolide efflux protein-like MFS transporter
LKLSLRGVQNQVITVFLIVWFGQLISLTGSGLTSFALGVWVYQRTGSVTQFAMTVLFLALPRIVLSPLAGTLVDKWDRRWIMILSDSGSGLTTLLAAGLLFMDQLQIWHVYIFVALGSAFSAFQSPAYIASTALLVPKAQFGRANGLVQIGGSIASLVSPLLAGYLMVVSGIGLVLLIDVATFLFAVGTLMLVRFPEIPGSPKSVEEVDSLWQQALLGWRHITKRRGLLALLLIYAATSFLGITTEVLLTPYVLSFGNPEQLGGIVSATGAGLLVGGLVMTTWGGPSRKINGIIGFEMMVGVCTLLIGWWMNALAVGALVFAYFVFIALSDACSLSLWQTKVAPDFQGRVFALRQMISLSALPLGLAITAPLAEYVFEPMLSVNGALAGNLGRLIGVGPGRGIGLIFILTGVFNCVVLLMGALNPRVWRIENEIPDAI